MVYRFKIWFEDIEDVVRWIEIKPSHTFFDFHNAIQDAIGFDKKEMASFYTSDDKWRKLLEISLEDMTDGDISDDHIVTLMKDSRIVTFVNDPHQRFVYIADYVGDWTLFIELQAIADEQPRKEYPLLYRSEGKAPRQREDSKFKLIDDNEFDALAAKILAAKTGKNIMEGSEEELVADDDTDEDEDTDEFGFGELGSKTDDEFNMGDGFSELS